jgi:hypothetical protein
MLQIAHLERHHVLGFRARRVSEPIDPEVPETAREIGLGDLSKFGCRGHLY